MPEGKDIQLAQLVNTRDPEKVIEEVLRIFYYHYSEDSALRVRLAFSQVRSLFAGEFPGYRECLAEYHDFNHTMSVLLAAARLLDGYNVERVFLTEELAIQLFLAALLHDTGYIQEEWDTAVSTNNGASNSWNATPGSSRSRSRKSCRLPASSRAPI